MNPNYDMVDCQVSDILTEVIVLMMEDADLVSSTARGMDATSMTASMAATRSASQTVQHRAVERPEQFVAAPVAKRSSTC